MTDSNFCCLCASDEGVFLDIFTSSHRQLGNRSFVNEFETCLSLKVDRDDALSTTICHRCAIELGQCNQFIQKYNKTYDVLSKQKKNEAKKSCCFCLTKGPNNYLFALAKDFRSSIHPLQKIYECFDRRITREEAEFRLICLSCRYNLDLLYDLKKLAREVETKLKRIAESRAILANLPKTETFVVNRKTTVICQSKLEIQDPSDSESESETMARKKTRSKKTAKSSTVTLKLRTCGQCQSSIEGGVDMYRLHSTGVTVCKMCWITMDPLNNNRSNKRRRQSQGDVKNTRLCAVFLKDVLTDPPSSKEQKVSTKVDKNQKEGPIYVISDESEDDDEPLSQTLKKTRSKVHSSEEERNSRAKRSLKQDESDGGSKKKLKSVKNEATPSGLRRSARYQSSDSDTLRDKSKAGKAAKSSKPEEKMSRRKSKKNGGNDSSSSNSDVGRTLRKTNDINSNDDTCEVNEKPIEDTTNNKEIDSGEEEEESIQPSDKPESLHQDDKVPDVLTSTNGLPAGESTSDPPRETVDDVSPDLKDTEKKLVDSVSDENNVDIEEKIIKETDEVEKTVNGTKDTEENVTADGEKELGEELESDTDIRIVDSGSSGEDSNQQSEKVANDEENVDNVSSPKEADDSIKAETLTNDDKVEEEDASKIDSVNADDESLKNGGEEEDVEKVSPVVTEVLQEVMDLASAEVQKRSDSGIASLPETLENISDEVNKTGEDTTATVENTDVDPAEEKETESIELESNSATNTLENYLELSNTEV